MSTSVAILLFLGTSLIFTKLKKRREASRESNINNIMTKVQVLKLRGQHFSKRVSVSYANSGPLMIVGGHGSRLIDETGRSYLDTRNNVAHCGHNHPRVVQAVQRQVATLNTNTRYLHFNVVQLAKRLANTLPDPLEVVFFSIAGVKPTIWPCDWRVPILDRKIPLLWMEPIMDTHLPRWR